MGAVPNEAEITPVGAKLFPSITSVALFSPSSSSIALISAVGDMNPEISHSRTSL